MSTVGGVSVSVDACGGMCGQGKQSKQTDLCLEVGVEFSA